MLIDDPVWIYNLSILKWWGSIIGVEMIIDSVFGISYFVFRIPYFVFRIPEMKGFSAGNLRNLRQFSREYIMFMDLQQPVAEIPGSKCWKHQASIRTTNSRKPADCINVIRTGSDTY